LSKLFTPHTRISETGAVCKVLVVLGLLLSRRAYFGSDALRFLGSRQGRHRAAPGGELCSAIQNLPLRIAVTDRR